MSIVHRLRQSFAAIAAAVMAGCLVAGASAPAVAQAPPKHFEFNLDQKGLLLKGYDPVAYFKSGTPAMGSDKMTAAHNGATFRFANAANRDAFLQEPEKYLPAYGGYCAYGVAQGYKVDGDPTVWKIVDGKLYVNIDKSVGRKFSADTTTYIKQADTKWPAMKDRSPQDVNK